MAHCILPKRRKSILLGFEDELVNEKNKYFVNFTTNKIGGQPDWIHFDQQISNPSCKLCGLKQLLVVQIYAPLENSFYHRTLYIFACINPNCWNQTQSWTCLRSQIIDHDSSNMNTSDNYLCEPTNSKLNAKDWCANAEDWDEDFNNGNKENDNTLSSMCAAGFSGTSGEQDDEDEDSSESLPSSFLDLTISLDNNNEAQGGAIGHLPISPIASAEIEKDEKDELISIDIPILPKRNLVQLMQEVTPLPENLNQSIQFQSSFISVTTETEDSTNEITAHIRELMHEYQLKHMDDLKFLMDNSDSIANSSTENAEKYEKSIPIHGDKIFHHFVNQIQKNPGQIIRYSRDNKATLFMSPVKESSLPSRCSNCLGRVVFELQILPTLIPILKIINKESTSYLSNSSYLATTHLEFGTVLIYTCEKSCWKSTDTFLEEYVIVQSEPV